MQRQVLLLAVAAGFALAGCGQDLAQQYQTVGEQAKSEQILKELVRLQPKQEIHRLRLARFYAATQRTRSLPPWPVQVRL